MPNNSFSSGLEAFDESWLLEYSSTIAPAYPENHLINPRSWELNFSPSLDQEISILAEESSINDDNGLRDYEYSTLVESSDDPNMFFEQYSNTLQNTCTSSRVVDLNRNNLAKQDSSPVSGYLRPGKESVRKGFSSKTRERKSKIKDFETEKRAFRTEPEEESLAKKQDHNAKERVRRMKLHASYIALGSVLPFSRTLKKRWTAPVVIDKVLDYIPELEKEIQQLIIKKNSILSVTENRQSLADKKEDSEVEAILTVSLNEVRNGELILQICRKRDEANNVFSNLLQSIEDEGICIVSASTIHVCEERECYHVHIQIKESSSSGNGGNHIAALKEKVISQLS